MVTALTRSAAKPDLSKAETSRSPAGWDRVTQMRTSCLQTIKYLLRARIM